MERPSILLCVAPQQQLKNTYRFRNFFRIIFVVGISRKKNISYLIMNLKGESILHLYFPTVEMDNNLNNKDKHKPNNSRQL